MHSLASYERHGHAKANSSVELGRGGAQQTNTTNFAKVSWVNTENFITMDYGLS
jgi:hypothetical protein